MNERQLHHRKKFYNTSTAPHTSSLMCKQNLSVDELEERTQNNRIQRKLKMDKHKELKNSG